MTSPEPTTEEQIALIDADLRKAERIHSENPMAEYESKIHVLRAIRQRLEAGEADEPTSGFYPRLQHAEATVKNLRARLTAAETRRDELEGLRIVWDTSIRGAWKALADAQSRAAAAETRVRELTEALEQYNTVRTFEKMLDSTAGPDNSASSLVEGTDLT